MASSADNSTALALMSEANSDFLEFINNLRAFLQGTEPVTFNIAGGITVNSLLKLINDYRNGSFQEVILGGPSSGTQIKLSVDSDGKLVVTDIDGNMAYVECSSIKSSVLEDCLAKNVTAENVKVLSVIGSVSVSGGTVRLKLMELRSLRTDMLRASTANVSNLTVTNNVQCTGLLSYGTRQFRPSSVRRVFYRDDAVLDNASSMLHISVTNEWQMGVPSYLNPGDLGFKDSYMGISPADSVPDLVSIMGDNAYRDFVGSIRAVGIIGRRAPLTLTDNILVSISSSVQGLSYVTVGFDTKRYELAAAMMWPTGAWYMQGANGYLYLTSFSSSDNGKEIYYQVLSNPWKIYRIMRVTYKDTQPDTPDSVSFDGMVELPAYSCTRFIARIHDSRNEQPSVSPRTVIYSLEYA